MQLFSAKLDNWELRILDISDAMNQSIVRQEFVGADGAVLQNMGRTAREIKFRCWFYGADPTPFSASYLNHFDFLATLADTSRLHALVHPKYGRLEGLVDQITVTHDDTQDYAAVDVNFVQQGLQETNRVIPDSRSLQTVLTQQALALCNGQIASVIPASLTASGFAGALGKAVDVGRSFASQITNVDQATKNFLREADTFVAQVDGFFKDVAAPATTLSNAVAYVGDLPSRIVGPVVNCSDRIMGSLSALSNLPVNFINAAIYQMDSLRASVTGEHADFFKSTVTSIWSGTLAARAGALYQADDRADAAARALENSRTFDLKGRRLAATPTPWPMTVQDVEGLAYSVRQYMQGALDYDRDQKQIRDMASSIQSYVSGVKLAKQSLVATTLPGSTPIHVLCMQVGLPYNSADRVRKVNPSIHNPTFMTGEVDVYAR